MEKKKPPSKIYHSRKVLGQLYDHVERVSFEPRFAAPFDTTILNAFDLSEEMLEDASKLKADYDNHMHRIMAQHAIKTEFEVWSTFVMEHNHSNDFKLQEEIGQISAALKDQFKDLCIQKAGSKALETLTPFVAAMYTVTEKETALAVRECEEGKRLPKAGFMPLMTFPWLFPEILGRIAFGSRQADKHTDLEAEMLAARKLSHTSVPKPARSAFNSKIQDDIETTHGVTHRGGLLELDFQRQTESQVVMDRQKQVDDAIDEEADTSSQDEEEPEEIELKQTNAGHLARLDALM